METFRNLRELEGLYGNYRFANWDGHLEHFYSISRPSVTFTNLKTLWWMVGQWHLFDYSCIRNICYWPMQCTFGYFYVWIGETLSFDWLSEVESSGSWSTASIWLTLIWLNFPFGIPFVSLLSVFKPIPNGSRIHWAKILDKILTRSEIRFNNPKKCFENQFQLQWHWHCFQLTDANAYSTIPFFEKVEPFCLIND